MRTEPSFSADSDDHLQDSASNLHGSSSSESQLLFDYRQRYGLSTDPFVDDPHFPFYQGAQRRQTLEQLLHLCQFSHNLLVITGEYGVGKTRMAQALIDALDDSDDICFVEGQITSDINSLFSDVYTQFDLTAHEEFLAFCQKNSEQDGLVVLIIDNAHHLTDEVIGEVVNLLQENLESRLHLVLFAEPHLVDRMSKINAPDIILTDFFLEKLSLAETVDYLNFRMEMSDYLGPEIFVENKVEPWWRQSQGQLLPLHDYAQQSLLESVSSSGKSKSQTSNLLVPHIVATSVLVGGLFVGYLYFGGSSTKKEGSQFTESVSIPVATQFESSEVSSQLSSQASSLASVAAVASPVSDIQNIEPANIATSSSLPPSQSQITSEKSLAAQVVKQSVVPLAQANEIQSQLTQKNSGVGGAVSKEARRSESSSESTKVAAKPKSENNTSVTPKESGVFSAQEKTILSWDASEFTLQIVGLSNEKAALEFIANQTNKKDLLLFRSLRKGKDWFVVVSGHYPNSAKARQAAQLLPESQLKAAPWPRDLKTIQTEIRQR
jgi:DamX protein